METTQMICAISNANFGIQMKQSDRKEYSGLGICELSEAISSGNNKSEIASLSRHVCRDSYQIRYSLKDWNTGFQTFTLGRTSL